MKFPDLRCLNTINNKDFKSEKSHQSISTTQRFLYLVHLDTANGIAWSAKHVSKPRKRSKKVDTHCLLRNTTRKRTKRNLTRRWLIITKRRRALQCFSVNFLNWDDKNKYSSSDVSRWSCYRIVSLTPYKLSVNIIQVRVRKFHEETSEESQ